MAQEPSILGGAFLEFAELVPKNPYSRQLSETTASLNVGSPKS
jgi:hypothetical protein